MLLRDRRLLLLVILLDEIFEVLTCLVSEGETLDQRVRFLDLLSQLVDK